jgi:hypothetical protein
MVPSGAAWSAAVDARSRNANATSVLNPSLFAAWLGQGKAIEPRHILPHDLPLFVRRNPFEIPLDDLA